MSGSERVILWSDAELEAFVADFDHHDPRFIENPSPVYEELRDRCPVLHSPRYGGFWLVTRYEDVRRAAKDWRTFTSSVPNVTSIPASHPRAEADIPIEVDPPLHTRYRQLVAPVFSRAHVDRMRPQVEAIAADTSRPTTDHGVVDLSALRGPDVASDVGYVHRSAFRRHVAMDRLGEARVRWCLPGLGLPPAITTRTSNG